MSAGLERLLDTLLFEGYALYPYTPEAAKNATPTPFGILYPPAYAALGETTFDHLRLAGRLEAGADAELEAEVRLLQPCGPRHQASPRRLVLAPAAVGDLAGAGVAEQFSLPAPEGPPLDLRLRLHAEREAPGRWAVVLEVENRTAGRAGADRAAALQRASLSTHPLVRARGGRFASPLEPGAVSTSVNTWPVLATDDDTALLGAAIVLPDHPQLAPESLGDLFDATEIEEALLLHVHALSDDEREAITRQDPVVREMVARAAAATPQEALALHGRVTLRDPVTTAPPTPSAAVRDPSRGEDAAEVDGVRFRRGTKVVLRPGPDADLHARLLDGHPATIERIYVDYDGKVHLGVSVDDDPGRELLRETGRFLFFYAPEVEVIRP